MNIKKKLAALLAAVMVLSLAGTAWAAESGAKSFADAAGTWAEEDINRIVELGLMDGKTDSSFAPNENMTRACLVEALYRLAGRPAVNGKNPFTDVPGGASYENAVIWASAQGIVGGRTASTFDPDGDVKRQEIAKILNIFAAKQMKKDALVSRRDVLAAYADADSVASWAKAP